MKDVRIISSWNSRPPASSGDALFGATTSNAGHCGSIAAGSVAPGCAGVDPFGDPVLDAERAALGPEEPNVPEGPLHRPGQPCAVCHRDGGEDPVFAFAGTVYRDPVEKVAVADAMVVLTDAAGKTFMTTTGPFCSLTTKAETVAGSTGPCTPTMI